MAKDIEFHGHKLIKGVFTTPFNQLGNTVNNSWHNGRLVDFIWLGFILEYYGRKEGLEKARNILSDLKTIDDKYNIVRKTQGSDRIPVFNSVLQFSKLLTLEETKQNEVYEIIKKWIDKEALAPLTLIFTYSYFPVFSKCFNSNISYQDRVSKLEKVIKSTLNHQSNESTDIRFLVIYYTLVIGKLFCVREMVERICMYPMLEHADEKMKEIRPMIRSLEIGTLYTMPNEFCNFFWDRVSLLGECKMAYIKYESESSDAESFLKLAKAKLAFYSDIYVNIEPLDIKMAVLLGLATFAYKRLLEVVEHNLYNSIAGRSHVRGIVECLVTMKYLIKHEADQPSIWQDFQDYGVGGYKMICERYDDFEKEKDQHHVDYKYINMLVEERVYKEFIDIDTRYFDKKNIKQKCEDVNEKEAYGLVYDYDSQYEHALWGAIRESSMLACNSPMHKYHNIPDVENYQRLKSVWSDCKLYFSKILDVLRDLYGCPDIIK